MARKGKAKRPPQPPPRRRPSGLVVVLAFAGAIGVAVALVVLAIVLRSDDQSAAPSNPTPLVALDGIPQDGIILGSPSASVTIIEYADLQCPACRAFAETVLPTVIDQYVRPGDVKAEFRGISFIGPDSERALRFVEAAGLQNRLWDLQEAFYRHQGRENSGWVTEELVRRLAGEIPGLDVDRLFDDAEGAEVDALLRQAVALAQEDEITGTPSVFIQTGIEEPVRVERPSAADVAVALDAALGR